MEKDYDVIIVGAGPAGLSTGRTVAEKGLRCLIVDKAKEIGFPVRTSGASWIDEMTALGVPSTCFNPVSKISLIAPTEEARFHYEKPVACILDVTEVNKFLASHAKDLGADIRLESEVKDILHSEGFMHGVELLSDGRTEKLSCKVVVDASGINATIVRKMGWLKYWERIGLGVQYDIESPNIDPDWLGLYMGNNFIPSGYGWFFPWKKGRARVGLGIIRPDSYANPLSYINDFLKSDKLPGIKDDYDIIKKEVGVFPCAGPLETTVANGFLAVGDSAGQGSPLHGEGIRYAIRFGAIAGNTIYEAIKTGDVSKKALYGYERAWKKAEKRNFKIALAIQKHISKYDDAHWDKSIKFIGQVGAKDPEALVQMFKTNFSYRNIWRVFKQSPFRAMRFLARSV